MKKKKATLPPEEVERALSELFKSLPSDLASDKEAREAVCLYFELGGKKLAQKHIETLSLPFNTRFELVRRRLVEEEDFDEDAEDNENEDDDDVMDDPDSMHEHPDFDGSSDLI